ncbi:MAG TPA: GAF domain-containing protein, partial [Pyrinomonadaceae bacterium]|nr:GAF domain-containing protein [Pyrinomonadaceae bacterium]
MPEKRAKLILEVAQAIGTQLEMSELLAALNNTLKPIVHFDAVAIMILEGDAIGIQWAHLEGFPRKVGECFESVVTRYASAIKVEPPPMKLPAQRHPISEIMKSGRPYIAPDLEVDMGFDTDQPLLNYGFRSYIDLPLIKQ